MLSSPYYAKNYASIIDSGLSIAYRVHSKFRQTKFSQIAKEPRMYITDCIFSGVQNFHGN